MAKLVSQTYAQALFELAVEENKTSLLLDEASGLLEVIRTNAEFGRFMNHPKIPREEKIEVVKNVFDERISKELEGFSLQSSRRTDMLKLRRYWMLLLRR